MDRPRRAGLRAGQAAVVPAAGGRRRARRRCAGDDPFIMQADGKGWLFAPNGLLDGPLPTHYEPHESPVRNPLYGQQANPTRKVYPRTDNPLNPSPPEEHSRGLPVRVHHLPAHRAPHGRRDEPVRCRTWPSCSRRCSSRSPRSWPRERGLEHLRLGHVVTGRGRDRGPGAGHRPARAAARRRAGSCTRSGCPTTGAASGLVTGDSANDLFGVVARPERADPGEQGRHLRHPARPPAHAAPSCSSCVAGLPAAGRDHRRAHRPRRSTRRGDRPTGGRTTATRRRRHRRRPR